MEELEAKTQLLDQQWEEFRQAQQQWQAEKMASQLKLDNEKLAIDKDRKGLTEQQKELNEKIALLNQENEKLKIGRKELDDGKKALATEEVKLKETLLKLEEQKMKLKDEQERVIFERENLSGKSDRIRDATMHLELETETISDCQKQVKAAEEKAAVTSKVLDEREAALVMAKDLSTNTEVDGKLEEEILVAKRTAEEYRIAKEMIEKDFNQYKSNHEKDIEENAKLKCKISELQAKLGLVRKRHETENTSRKRAELGIHEDGSTKKRNRKRIRTISESDNDDETTFPPEDDELLLNAAGGAVEVPNTTVIQAPKPIAESSLGAEAPANDVHSKSQLVLDPSTNVVDSDSAPHNPLDHETEKQTNNSAPASSSKYFDPVSCEVCRKSCFNPSTLNRHSFLHMPSQETRRFPCKRCGRKFTRKDNCRAHYKKNACVYKDA